MKGYMKENGKMIKDMVEVMKGTQMEIYTSVNSNMERLMEKECINGLIAVNYMMENGLKV